MENFIVSARKYRPQEFDSVVGQSHITDTLEHAIENNQLAQALLFCGPRGVGKTTCARILARKINEKSGATDEEGFAFNIYELDAASNNSVDDIRHLIDQVRFAPQVGQYKVYIIDEVHMLSQAAFNAFLKTLEEPPAHAIFILATTEKHKIIPTILSRCQIYDFKRITIEDIQNHLKKIAEKEGIAYEDDALFLIAQKADGALRDALSIFDRLTTFSQKNITLANAAEILNILDYDQYLKVADLAKENDIPAILAKFDEIVKKGFDPHIFIAGLGSHFRDLMLAQNPSTLALIEIGENTKAKYAEQSQKWTAQQLVNAVEICNHADINYKNSKNPRLTVEIALMQLASLTAVDADKKKKFLILAPLLRNGEKPRESAPKNAETPSPQTPSAGEIPKPEVKKAAQPIGTKIISEFSIKKHIEDSTKEAEPSLFSQTEEENLPEHHFTETDLQTEWNNFLLNLAKENSFVFNAINSFKSRKVGENEIEIAYSSESAKKEFTAVEGDFLHHFQHKVNNFKVEIRYTLDPSLKREVLTDKKRYERLAEINPVLKDLHDLVKFDFS